MRLPKILRFHEVLRHEVLKGRDYYNCGVITITWSFFLHRPRIPNESSGHSFDTFISSRGRSDSEANAGNSGSLFVLNMR